MALQRPDGTLPGADSLLEERPEGSIAEVIYAFLRDWVELQPVTSRRAYERSLVLFARDLDENGPGLLDPSDRIDTGRMLAHFEWRRQHGLFELSELRRCCVHLGRFATWLDCERGLAIGVTRDSLRVAIDANA